MTVKMKGLVIKNTGSSYLVKTDDGDEILCKIKGNFRIKGIRTTNPVAVGDRVTLSGTDSDTAYISAIEPRKNYIIRRASNLSKQAHIIAANLDQVCLIVTLAHPTTSTTFIDRFLATAEAYRVPAVIVINKIDLVKNQADLEAIVDHWKQTLPNAEIFPTSAKEHFNVDNLMNRIIELLPESAPYFGKDALTDKPARFFVTEIIREKILLEYDKEVPYSVEVIVEKFEEKDNAIHIMAVIYVERDSQKGIIIGHGGTKIKRVGTEARKDIEKFFGKRVYLELFVKVEPNWRNRENKLRTFGYIE